jgi:uncharacterized protein (TIGR00730 family)
VLERVCVFCGSNVGSRPAYAQAAAELGHALAVEGITLVFGGGDVGLMGVLADAALEAGGAVIGIIPESLMAKELGHRGVSELIVTGSMHERKALMAELADGFVALPGGLGTWEELCEMLTWSQLGFHAKPVTVLDVEDFYEPLFALFDRAVLDGFVRPEHQALATRSRTVEEALAALASPAPRPPHKWIDRDQT